MVLGTTAIHWSHLSQTWARRHQWSAGANVFFCVWHIHSKLDKNMGNWFVWKITAGIVRVNWPRASQSWWHSSPSTFSPPLGEPNKIYECDFATRPCISGACKEIAKAWIRSHRSSGSLICSLQWILDLPVVHLDRPFKLKIPEPLHELIEWCVVIFARIFDK